MSDAAGLRCLSVIWSYLLAVERSLSFLPSREARCCSRASRRELGAWGGWGSADYNHGQVGKLGHLARFSLLSSLLISSLSHTHKAAAKFRHHPQIHYLLYDSSLFSFFFFFFNLVSSGLVGQHAHVSFGSCKRVHSRTDRSGQSRASSLRGSRVETQQTRLWTI